MLPLFLLIFLTYENVSCYHWNPQQATTMFNDTLKANIAYGKRDATDEELEKAAKDAQLMDFIKQLPEGWETMVGDRGLKLSGGEKQRTAVSTHGR